VKSEKLKVKVKAAMLAAGTRLGPYEIVSTLGAGGMGEVYRARDTKLGRDVAIKVLPASFAQDPDRLARFEREARVLAALNHPHIAAIYGLEESGGIRALVLELVEGPTLAETLAQGVPLRLEDALRVARQIADALEAAHEKGIMHRDLKPSNIILQGAWGSTPTCWKTAASSGDSPPRVSDVTVKVLDFGLAKALASDPAEPDLSQSPTVEGTRDGIILGTAAYMSPEQARGHQVDKRTDIWAFGCVLYRMLTGHAAFAGDTISDTIAAILEREPDWHALPQETPPAIRRLLQRCLEKDAKRRLRDIGDGRVEIDDALSVRATNLSTEVTPPTAAWRWSWWGLAAAASLALGALATLLWQRQSPVESWQNPLANATFDRLTDFDGSELDAAISADGKFVAFVSDRDGPFDAFVTQLGSGEFLNLTKGRIPQLLNEDLRNVGFSGDAAHVWIRVGEIASPQRISLTPTIGGALRPFLDTGVTVTWSPDKSRVAYHEAGLGDPIYVADSNGGNPRQIFVDKPDSHCHFPTWSPDARFLYFARGFPPNEMDIWRIPSTGGEPERITHHHSRVAYPVFLNDRTLIYTATADDGTGPWLYAMDVEQRVARRVNVSVEQYISISASAETPGQPRRLVATVSNPSVNLFTVPITEGLVEESAVTRFALPTARSAAPRFGPDSVVYLASRGGADLLWQFKDGTATELWKPSEGSVAATAAISPDDGQMCFPVRQQARARLYCTTADGTNLRALAESLDVRGAVSWSPDGKWLAVAADQGEGVKLFKVPVDGGAPVRLVDSVSANPVWSTDGKYILYSHSGQRQGRTVSVKAVSPEGEPYPLPDLWVDRSGESYRFLPGGRQLVLKQGGFRRQNFWLLDLTTGRRRQLTNLRPGSSLRSFDVSPDGKSILFERVQENSDIVLIELGRQ